MIHTLDYICLSIPNPAFSTECRVLVLNNLLKMKMISVTVPVRAEVAQI